MAFTEALKLKVRKRAHLSCCLCKTIGVEVHHIIPQEEGGPDTEDNAVPLCPSCHEIYGSNPQKRKFIREARDLWYEICQKRYVADSPFFTSIKNILEQVVSRKDLQSVKEEVLASIRQQNGLQECRKGKIHKADGGSWREGARVFDIDDLLMLLHSRKQIRDFGQIGFLLIEEAWPKKGGWRDTFREFLKEFGKHAAAKMASRVIDEMELVSEVGLTAREIGEAINRLSVEMTCYLLTYKREIESVLDRDGEWWWQLRVNS